VAVAGFDVLRDEGEEYASRLRDAGVPVTLQRLSGLIHGFANAIGVGRSSRAAMLEVAAALRAGLA
jgi:acetyl esterase